MPRLRERGDDIVLLAEHFLAQTRGTQPSAGFSSATLAELRRRTWPGNVRELRSAVQQAGLLARGQPIMPEHLPRPRELMTTTADDDVLGGLQRAIRAWTAAELSGDTRENLYQQLLKQIEPPFFDEVLKVTGHNRAAAADLLGLHRATLRKKLR